MAKAVGIDDGAAFERGDNTHDAHATAGAIDGDFGTSGDVAALFDAATDAEASSFGGFLRGPAELFRSGDEDIAQACVRKIFEPEFERIDPGGVGEFVHGAFASKVIRGRSEATIGTLTERRFCFVELDTLV